MQIVTIKIADRIFKLQCSAEGKEKLVAMGNTLNKYVQNNLDQSPRAGFDLALVMAALQILDEKDSEVSKLTDSFQDSNNDVNNALAEQIFIKKVFTELSSLDLDYKGQTTSNIDS